MKVLKKSVTIIIPTIVALFNVLIFLFPAEIISAARDGLSLWFNNVLPSLLPFVIGVNILTGLGFVNFAGVLLEPVMYPLFGVPGCGGFALITGITSGYPMGAKTVAILREKEELTQVEAQRLAGFVNNSGPLFILGAVGVTMFGCKNSGYFLMVTHYLSAIVVGLILKHYGRVETAAASRRQNILRRAYRSMRKARQKDGRPFGRLLGDSVGGAMEMMVQVGGFIILFCVIVRVFDMINLVGITEKCVSGATGFLGMTSETYKGFFVGLFEITNGIRGLAEGGVSRDKLLTAAFLISFGGLSIHAQTVSFLGKTDIKPVMYMACKLLQGIIAVIIGGLIYNFFDFQTDAAAIHVSLLYSDRMVGRLAFSSVMFIMLITLMILFLIGAGVFARFVKKTSS